HTISTRDWSSDVCSSDLGSENAIVAALLDETKVSDAASTTGAKAEDIKALRDTILNSERVIVVFGDELRGAAVEALSLFETALRSEERRVGKEWRCARRQ